MDGILVIDKPSGITSHDVVSRARHILHERRIGHTGTLDPFATGVLILMVGRATRLSQFLSGMEKEYEAIIRLGFATDTGDRTGERITPPESGETQGKLWSESEIEAALRSLRGDIVQIPPMYSAKKIKGEKLYELARRGEQVERKPVNVCIHEFSAIKPAGQLIKDNLDGTYDLFARVVCSSGTYVRTLAEDLGKRLNSSAHLAELRRTRVGDFSIDDAITLADLTTRLGEEALGTVLLPSDTALSRMPFVHLSDDDERKVRNGREVAVAEGNWPEGATIRLCAANGQLIAVGDFDVDRKRIHPRVVLVGND